MAPNGRSCASNSTKDAGALSMKNKTRSNTRSMFTVMVPTINSARWIHHLHHYYVRIGVDPLYCIDSRTRDGTAEVLSHEGARWVMVASEHPRVESLIKSFQNIVSTPWILRVDDDECPSQSLMEWVRKQNGQLAEDAVSFCRKWLR